VTTTTESKKKKRKETKEALKEWRSLYVELQEEEIRKQKTSPIDSFGTSIAGTIATTVRQPFALLTYSNILSVLVRIFLDFIPIHSVGYKWGEVR
jgi:hypothetical protein